MRKREKERERALSEISHETKVSQGTTGMSAAVLVFSLASSGGLLERTGREHVVGGKSTVWKGQRGNTKTGRKVDRKKNSRQLKKLSRKKTYLYSFVINIAQILCFSVKKYF